MYGHLLSSNQWNRSSYEGLENTFSLSVETASSNGAILQVKNRVNAASFIWLVATALMSLSACDVAERFLPKDSAKNYAECLRSALAGSHNLNADEIRSICAELSGVVTPTYKVQNDNLVPGDEFTRCYVREKKALESKGVAKAGRLAQLSCKYPDVD